MRPILIRSTKVRIAPTLNFKKPASASLQFFEALREAAVRGFHLRRRAHWKLKRPFLLWAARRRLYHTNHPRIRQILQPEFQRIHFCLGGHDVHLRFACKNVAVASRTTPSAGREWMQASSVKSSPGNSSDIGRIVNVLGASLPIRSHADRPGNFFIHAEWPLSADPDRCAVFPYICHGAIRSAAIRWDPTGLLFEPAKRQKPGR